jgi:hypothetical protein
MAADEGGRELAELRARHRAVQHRRPEAEQDQGFAAGGEAGEAAQRVERAVGVAGARAGALGLGALHHRAQARLAEAEAEDVAGRLEDDAQLVVVLAGEAGAVRGRADLDQQDRRREAGGSPARRASSQRHRQG